MVSPSIGSVVLVKFPFSDLSNAKLRPALVIADAGRGDWVLCQITSKPYGDLFCIELKDGRLDGTWTAWHENGEKLREGAHKNDKEDGYWVEWDEKGRETKETFYRNGKEVRSRTAPPWEVEENDRPASILRSSV
jgi:hypothetical protein